MKKPTMITAGVFVALIAIFFAVRGSDSAKEKTIDFQIPKMASLDKIEIVKGDKKTVLAKEAGGWHIKEPIDFPLAVNVEKDLEVLFNKAIPMDQDMGKADPARFEINDASAVVTLYDGGKKVTSFKMGKEISVQPTLVKRTYIQPEGATGVMRARAGLSSKLDMELEKMRRKKLVDFKKEEVTALELEYDGQKVRLEATDKDGALTWKSAQPPGEKLDDAAIGRLAGAIGTLRIDNFVDGVSAADAGLDKPLVKTTVIRKSGDPVVLMIGAAVPPKEGEKVDESSLERYIKLGGSDWIYSVKSYTANNLLKRLADLRNKDMLKFESAKVTKLTVTRPGEGAEITSVAVQPDKTWKVTSPKEAKADKSLVDAALRMMGAMKAERVPNISAADAGLAPEVAIKVDVDMGAESKTIYVGKTVAADKKARYVRVGADGPIFELAGYQVEKIVQMTGEKLAPPPPPKGAPGSKPGGAPGSMPAGLPGGLPPGMIPPGSLPPGMIPPGAVPPK